MIKRIELIKHVGTLVVGKQYDVVDEFEDGNVVVENYNGELYQVAVGRFKEVKDGEN